MLLCVSSFAVNKEENIPAKMLSNTYLDALEYVGYDVSEQKNNKSLYKRYGSNVESGILSDIGYGWYNSKDGLDTVTKKSGKTLPDVEAFENKSLCCASYVAYVVFNYLPNVKGVDTSEYIKPVGTTRVTYWKTALNRWVDSGISRHTSPDEKNFSWKSVPIGSILIFGGNEHIAIYAGCYNNTHFVTHVGNGRGPEISTVEALSTSKCGRLTDIYIPDYLFGLSKTVISVTASETRLDIGNSYIYFENTENGKKTVVKIDGTSEKTIVLPVGNYKTSIVLENEDFVVKKSTKTLKVTNMYNRAYSFKANLSPASHFENAVKEMRVTYGSSNTINKFFSAFEGFPDNAD